MDEYLRIEINSNHSIYSKDVYLSWIRKNEVCLVINGQHIPFNFESKCFELEEKPLFSISMSNSMIPCCIEIEARTDGWKGDEYLGKFQHIVFCNDLILTQFSTNSTKGTILAAIKPEGIYTPEANSFLDDENRFDFIDFLCGGRTSKIWKVC